MPTPINFRGIESETLLAIFSAIFIPNTARKGSGYHMYMTCHSLFFEFMLSLFAFHY